MSEAVQIALIATIAPTLVAFGGVLVSLRNGRKSDRIEVKTDEVHAVTNSNLKKVTDELVASKGEVSALREVVNNFLRGNKSKTP